LDQVPRVKGDGLPAVSLSILCRVSVVLPSFVPLSLRLAYLLSPLSLRPHVSVILLYLGSSSIFSHPILSVRAAPQTPSIFGSCHPDPLTMLSASFSSPRQIPWHTSFVFNIFFRPQRVPLPSTFTAETNPHKRVEIP